MDLRDSFRQGAAPPEGNFALLLVFGFVLSTKDSTPTVSIRTVADEVLLQTLLTIPTGRQWLHDALNRLCDATRPPDDQPREARVTRLRGSSTDFPRDGTGGPR